jgi:hypothetical protein
MFYVYGCVRMCTDVETLTGSFGSIRADLEIVLPNTLQSPCVRHAAFRPDQL